MSVAEIVHGAPDITDVLAAIGSPFTRQRRLLWEYFLYSGRAATITEAVADMRSAGISQATVYRTVAWLADLGLLLRVQSRSGDSCYTAALPGHRHPLVCGECRRVVEFDGEHDLTELQQRLERETGFEIYGHHLEVYGLCPLCAQRAEGSTGVEDRPQPEAAPAGGGLVTPATCVRGLNSLAPAYSLPLSPALGSSPGAGECVVEDGGGQRA